MLQQGFRRSSAQNSGLGGDVKLKSGEPAAVPIACCRSTENEDLAWTAALSTIYCYKRDITCPGKKSAVFTTCYANAHAAIGPSTCTELPGGHGSQDVFERL